MSLFKKSALGIFAGITLLILSLISLVKLEESATTMAKTFEDPQTISISSRQTAFTPKSGVPMLLAPYKELEVFISKEYESDFNFTSIGLAWDEFAPDGTLVDAEVKFLVDGKWSEWVEMEEEEDVVKEGKKYAMAATNPATAFKYKFLLYGDGNNTPVVQNAEWTFIKAGVKIDSGQAVQRKAKTATQTNETVVSAKTVTAQISPDPQFSAESITNYVATTTISTTVISRSSWGADESYRYLSDNSLEPELIKVDEEWYDEFADELQYSRVVEADENGDKYKWPLQYPEKVKKVIIHHTATTGNLDNPTQAIRDIYYYHAITRGWGDIGYNYIVDQNGKIYEGRYGGEGVIGAHSGPGNHGSIGIAVLGNYQDTAVPEKIIVGMSQFIYKKAKIHNIEVDGFSDFRGENMPNIFGHRDIMSTQCPGEYLYAKIPVIRSLSGINYAEKEKFVKNYDFQDLTELYYLELKPEETKEITLKLENIGKVNWDDKTFIVVDDNPAFTGVISFPTKSGFALAMMEESLVEPGETATFKFEIEAGKIAKTVQMNIAPVINGTQKLTDYVVLPVTVQAPIYKFEFSGAQYPPVFMKSGSEFEGWIKLKNTGNTIWRKSGTDTMSLTGSLLATLQQDTIDPGETGTFEFDYTAPAKAGSYVYSFSPSIEGATFTTSYNIGFSTTVYEREYDGKLVSKTSLQELEKGKPYTISIKLRNVGNKAWTEDDLKVIFMKDKNLGINSLSLSPTTVARGEVGTIQFILKPDSDIILGAKNLLVNPKIKDHQLMIPILFKFMVKEKVNTDSGGTISSGSTSSDSGSPSTGDNDIRVKIGFSGNPEITANGEFKIYSDNDLLKTLNAAEVATVEMEDGKYYIDADGTNFIKNDPVKFVPKDGAILQIKNFEHRPSWNQTLNDNEYRGTLEVRNVDGALTVINELDLEDYLKGLGEVSNTELIEKIKAIVVAARSYAYYYMTSDEKFPGKPYHLDDDPDVSQKYLGYGFEKRAPNVAAAVNATASEVLTYNGEVIKAPYFSQSDGTSTKSAMEVWGWDFTPYLVSVDDSFCDADEFLGHGVGLSGCGAHGMAAEGYDYEEILKHYYTGIEINTLD